jgi:serine/threonine protein kinase
MHEEIGRYQFPSQRHYGVWCTCPQRSCTVYLEFQDSLDDNRDIRRALRAAAEINSDALIITRRRADSNLNHETPTDPRNALVFTECQFKPYLPQFNSTFYAIDHENLTIVRRIKSNVVVALFQGEHYIYKFMTTTTCQSSFEIEAQTYQNLAGAPGIPTLRAVVRRGGVIQGLLISYIEGIDLWSLVKDIGLRDSELLDITYKIIRLAAGLEQRNFYHEDLKCSNIVRRQADGELFFVDLAGGLTSGMYREDRISHILFIGFDASDALFNLGRTLWELCAGESPVQGAPLDRIRIDMIRHIIRNCVEGSIENIGELYIKYYFAEIHGH